MGRFECLFGEFWGDSRERFTRLVVKESVLNLPARVVGESFIEHTQLHPTVSSDDESLQGYENKKSSNRTRDGL